MKQQSKTQESNVFVCETCGDSKEIDGHITMAEHLQNTHGIDIKNTKGTKRMLAHVDCRDSYSSTYAWEIGGVKFTQYIRSLRQKNDPMRFA